MAALKQFKPTAQGTFARMSVSEAGVTTEVKDAGWI
jgi:hypothetical protein